MTTPWEEFEEDRRIEEARQEAEETARRTRNELKMAVSGKLGIHPEFIEKANHLGDMTTDVYAPSAQRGECVDEDTIAAYMQWAHETEVFPEVLDSIPNIGDHRDWPLLLKAVARGSKFVKFPRELAELLRLWIPADMWALVVAK